jgi:tetratricopeptide (TPR) repeat protein
MILAVILGFVSSRAIAGESWVGKKIAIKMGHPKFGATDDNGKQVYYGKLSYVIYTVVGDQDGRLQVRHHGKEGWFDKTDAILWENAISYFTEQIRANPKDAEAYSRRGVVWDDKGEYDIAIKDYNECIRLTPGDAVYYCNRGRAFRQKKDYDRAIADLNEAIRLNPKLESAYNNRGFAFWNKKDDGRAIADWKEAIRLEPNYDPPHNNLAWIMATCPKAEIRNGKKAIKYARKACELSGWKNPQYLGTLGAAYAESGQFAEAIKWQKKAFEFPNYEEEFGKFGRELLKLYEKRMPYRQSLLLPSRDTIEIGIRCSPV